MGNNLLSEAYDAVMAECPRDIREPLTSGREVQFGTGWRDAAEGRRTYTARTLARITWRNLGYRLAQREGVAAACDESTALDFAAKRFAQSGG